MLNKVYCRKCKHCFDASNNSGGYTEYVCKASGELHDSYLEKSTVYKSCESLNFNNACVNYVPATNIIQKVWRIITAIKKL